MKIISVLRSLGLVFLLPGALAAGEIFVDASAKAPGGGTAAAPFPTIQQAADAARPGDTVTIAAGTYREWVNPPRGGTAETARITFRAKEGDRPVISGAEVVTGWKKGPDGLWSVHIPDSFIAAHGSREVTHGPKPGAKGAERGAESAEHLFNPFTDRIHGDFFWPNGHPNLRAMLVVDGVRYRMTDDTLEALRTRGAAARGSVPLLNLRSFRFGNAAPRDAGDVKASADVKPGKGGLSYVYDGGWVVYKDVKFDGPSLTLDFSSGTLGGDIEIRVGSPTGELLGTVSVPPTGGWDKWREIATPVDHFGETLNLSFVFRRPDAKTSTRWTAVREGDGTTLHAQFPRDPAGLRVETAVRPMCFYPTKTGRGYITLRGLTFENAAPNWAPPTAEQQALVGVNWSRGWIIEDCEIRNSTCAGVSLGKFGDAFDNYSGQNSQAFVSGIARAVSNGWSEVGHHVVRNCRIHHCGQVGIVGSMGCVFSVITNNVIHDIFVGEAFSGQEQACIKLHAPVDVLIADNQLSRCGYYGIWLDWMAQGARIARNRIFGSGIVDVFVEVSHGPVLIDNNILASGSSTRAWSQGCAYVNNYFGGNVLLRGGGDPRRTPFFKPHSVEIATMEEPNRGGDNQFVGNVSLKPLVMPEKSVLPYVCRDNAQVPAGALDVSVDAEGAFRIVRHPAWAQALAGRTFPRLTAAGLGGTSAAAKAPYTSPDGAAEPLACDIGGRSRAALTPPGPFAE